MVVTKRIDPRVTRTKQQLTSALFDLMQRRRWEKIRVQDVLDETGISRSAFYSHFDNKFDLLTAGIPDFTGFVHGDGPVPDLLGLFEHVDEMAPTLRPLLTQAVLSDVVERFQANLADSWRATLAGGPHEGDEVLVDMLAGALMAACRSYAVAEPREAPAEMCDRVTTHLRQLLE